MAESRLTRSAFEWPFNRGTVRHTHTAFIIRANSATTHKTQAVGTAGLGDLQEKHQSNGHKISRNDNCD